MPHIFPALRHLVYLVHQTWRSYKTIKYVHHVPILFLSSLKDELVPPGHMAKLYNISQTSGVKVWRDFENGTHNDTCMQVRVFLIWAEKEREVTERLINVTYRAAFLNPLLNLFVIMYGIWIKKEKKISR